MGFQIYIEPCRLCLLQHKKQHRCPHGRVCRPNDLGRPECQDCRRDYEDRWDTWARKRKEELVGA